MHELSLIRQEIERFVREASLKKVKKIYFNLGRLAHGTPESIKQAFSLATVDTPLFGAEVIVNIIEPKIRCSRCGYDFLEDKKFIFKCPKCYSTSIDVVAGKECSIDHLEYS